MKSASSSTRDSDKVLKRGPVVRETIEDDFRWLWAAYKLGTWHDLLNEGLSREVFREAVVELVSQVQFDWILAVPMETGLRPVGMVFADPRFGGNAIEPHVEWFPWATPRNKLECAIQFLKQIGKDVKIMLYIEEQDDTFWHRVWQYKVLKKACKIHDCYGRGKNAVMYYTPGPF